MAALMVVSAAVESVMLERSFTDPAVPFKRLLWAKVLGVPVAAVAIPLPLTPFVSAVKTTLVGVAAADANVFFTVGLPKLAPAPLPPLKAFSRLVRLAAAV